MALQPWQKGIVIKMEELNSSARSYFIQVPGSTLFDFKPGQFVTLDLPIHEKPNKRLRSYSIASSPDQSNVFELCVETNGTGAGSTYMFNEIRVGSELSFRGPAGVFTLPARLEEDMFFICEGSGVVPFRSMFNYILAQHIPHKEIYLFYGGIVKSDLLYHEELCVLEKQIEGFHYVPALLKEEDDICKQGTVHAVYENLIAKKSVTASKFYLCGWRDLVDKAKENILRLGFNNKDVIQELYG